MAGGVHPEIVDDDGGWGFAYIFGDEAKVCASIGSARCQLGFAVELVGDGGVVGHLAGVEGEASVRTGSRRRGEVLDWRGPRWRRRRGIARQR